MKVSREYAVNEYKRVITAGLEKEETFCLYFHNPFCCSVCSYCVYSPINLLTNVENYKRYYDIVLPQQLEELQPIFKIKRPDKMYFGGGTSSIIKPSFLKVLAEKIPDIKGIPSKAIEINPNFVSKELLRFLQETQFDYFSIGIQTFDEDTLSMYNRKLFSIEQLKDFISELRGINPNALVSVDLLPFLKNQTPEGANCLIEDLHILESAAPDRISIYPNFHVVYTDDKPLQYEYLSSLRRALSQFISGSDYMGNEEQLTLDQDAVIESSTSNYLLFHKNYTEEHDVYNCTGFFSDANRNQITFPIGAQTKTIYGFLRDTKFQTANNLATEFEVIKKHNGGYWNGK